MNLKKHREILIVSAVAAALVVGVRDYTADTSRPVPAQAESFPVTNQPVSYTHLTLQTIYSV